jgi:CRISPR-associated protein Csb2
MITTLGGPADAEIAWASRALPGHTLRKAGNGEHAAVLGALPGGDMVTARYTRASSTWTSVTPVVLPGYDDPAHYRRRMAQGVAALEQKSLLAKLNARIDRLIRKAIVQAGFSQELAQHARLEWRRVGFLAGTEPAERYGVPDHLKRLPRTHLRIEWRDRQGSPVEVPGPCLLGGGRFCGLGLMTG